MKGNMTLVTSNRTNSFYIAYGPIRPVSELYKKEIKNCDIISEREFIRMLNGKNYSGAVSVLDIGATHELYYEKYGYIDFDDDQIFRVFLYNNELFYYTNHNKIIKEMGTKDIYLRLHFRPSILDVVYNNFTCFYIGTVDDFLEKYEVLYKLTERNLKDGQSI